MERVFLFTILLLLASGYAVARGGAPERVVGLSFLLAFALSLLFQQPMAARFVGVEWGILTVDLVLLVILLGVALHADRFWPLWVTALHALGTGGHMVRGVDLGIEPVAYAILLASWSYPMVLLLALGTMRHRRRKRALGYDLDWSATGTRDGSFA